MTGRGLGRSAVIALVSLGLAGCGGGHRAHHVDTHHRHGSRNGQGTGQGEGAAEPSSFRVNPPLAPVSPAQPGLPSAAPQLPAATIHLSPPPSTTDKPQAKRAGKKLGGRIGSAPAGAVIQLAAGSYPRIYDTTQRTSWVTVSGEGDATKPVIDGARLKGASHIRFVDVKFSAGVHVGHLPSGHGALRSSDIQVLDSEIDCGATGTEHGKVGLSVGGASQNVLFSGDWVHNCTVGFTSSPRANFSQNITITHCLFETIFGDAIDLGGMDGLEITNNVIRDIHRSHGHHGYHDDGIQFFGNNANVVIAYNVEANSTDQLIFIQDAIKSKFSGTAENRDILVLGNLIYGAGALAAQDEGGVDVQFIGNTIWDNHDGSLRIRRSPYPPHIVPTHTLVADNIIANFSLLHVPNVVEGYNTFAKGSRHGTGDVTSDSPGFVDSSAGQFGLQSGSRAKRSAAPAATLVALARRAGANPAALKLIAAYRASDRGAVIADDLPSLGAPDEIGIRAGN